MSRWRSKRALRRALAVCLLLLIAAAVLWTQLPAMVERRAIARLTAAGFREPSLRVAGVGLHQLELGDMSLAAGPWSLHVGKGTLAYRPLALLRSELESLHVDDLTVAVDLATATTPAAPRGSAVSWNRLANSASAALPIRTVSVSGGRLRLEQGERRATIPFSLGLANDRSVRRLQLDARVGEVTETLRLKGELDPRTGGRVTAEFSLTNSPPWLALILPNDLSASLRASHLSSLEGAFDLRLPPGEEEVGLRGSLRPFQLKTPVAKLAMGEMTYRGQLGHEGVTGLRLTTAVDELAYSDWRVSAGAVSLELAGLATLKAEVDQVELAGAGGLDVAGDLTFVAAPLTPWQNTTGALEFRARRFEVGGVAMQPFAVALSGGPHKLEFAIPELSYHQDGLLRLTGVEGWLTGLLGTQAQARATGRVQLTLSSNLVAREPVAFQASAERTDAATSVGLCLDLTNVAVATWALAQPLALSGSVSASATFQTNQSHYESRLHLAVEETTVAGAMLQAVALSGEVDFTPGPDRRARSGGARFNWLSRQLPAAAGLAGDCSFDVGLAVGRLTLPNGLQIVEPQLRLRRSPAAAPESFPAIEFTVVASAVDYAGIELAVLKGAGALGPDAAWLKGSAKLAGQPFSYSFELRQVEDAATGAQCAGAFALGTLRLRDLVIPAALAGNQPVRVTGDLEVEGTMRLSPAGEWEIRPRLRLELERIEWPQKKLTVLGLRGNLRWDPPAGTGPVDVDTISIDLTRYGDYELTNAVVQLQWVSRQLARVQLVDARLFDGHVHIPPFVWDLRTGDLDPVVILEDVNLERLAKLLPQFTGSIEGYLNGRLPFSVKAGKARTTGARLELNRTRPARLEYPADGLLTGGLPPDSDRYRQLKLVEEGMKDLRLEALTVELYDPEHPQTPVRVHLEGTFTSPRAIVPIIFNLNVNGDLDQALRLLNLGDLQIFLD